MTTPTQKTERTKSTKTSGQRVEGLRFSNKGLYIDIGKAFGRAVTYGELAATFQISPKAILAAVYRAKGVNADAFELLYQDFRKNVLPIYAMNPVTEAKSQRHQYWVMACGRVDGVAETRQPYLAWKIPQEVILLIPKAKQPHFQIGGDRKNASRFGYIKVVKPEFAKLRLIAEKMDKISDRMQEAYNELKEQLESGIKQDIQALYCAYGFSDVLNQWVAREKKAQKLQPVGEWNIESELATEELYLATKNIWEEACQAFVTSPTMFNRRTQEKMRKASQDGLKLLNDHNGQIKDAVTKLAPYYYSGNRSQDWIFFESALIRLIRQMIQSDKEDEVVRKHVLPMFATIADKAEISRRIREKLPRTLAQTIESDWRSGLPNESFTSDSIFVQMLHSILAAAPGIAGRTTGPSSLLLSIVDVATPRMIDYFRKNSRNVGLGLARHSAMNLRVLSSLSVLSGFDFSEAVDCILDEDAAKLRDFNFEETAMSSRAWAGALAIVNLAVLVSVVTKDDDFEGISIDRIGEIGVSTANAGTSLLDFAASWKLEYAKTSEAAKASSASMARLATRFAMAASLFASVLSTITLVEEIGELSVQGDDFTLGDFGAIAGASGTLISSANWGYITLLMNGNVATSGASIAVMLNWISLIGAALVLAGALAVTVHDAITRLPGTAKYVQACLKHFEESEAGKTILGIYGDEKFKRAFREVLSLLEDRGRHVWTWYANVGPANWAVGSKWVVENCNREAAKMIFSQDDWWIEKWLLPFYSSNHGRLPRHMR